MNLPLNLFFASVSRLFEYYTTTAKCKRQYRVHIFSFGKRESHTSRQKQIKCYKYSNAGCQCEFKYCKKNTYVFHVFFRHFLLLKHFLLPFRKILRYKKKTGRGCNLLYSCSSEITKREHLSRDKKRLKFSGASKKILFYENISS